MDSDIEYGSSLLLLELENPEVCIKTFERQKIQMNFDYNGVVYRYFKISDPNIKYCYGEKQDGWYSDFGNKLVVVLSLTGKYSVTDRYYKMVKKYNKLTNKRKKNEPMLKITNTKNLTGITITGTREDIYELYESIGRVVGSGLEFENDSMPFLRILGINYDLRHCFMGDREVTFVDNGYSPELKKNHGKIHPETNVEFAVSIVWHEAMFAALALEDYIITHEDDKRFKNKLAIPELPEGLIEEFYRNRYKDVALVRLYQELIWEAFREATSEAAYKRLRKKSKAGQAVYYKSMNYTGFATQYMTQLEMKYINAAPEKRSKMLATHIGKIIKQSDDYQNVAREVREVAREHGISPSKVRYTKEEWPEELEW